MKRKFIFEDEEVIEEDSGEILSKQEVRRQFKIALMKVEFIVVLSGGLYFLTKFMSTNYGI